MLKLLKEPDTWLSLTVAALSVYLAWWWYFDVDADSVAAVGKIAVFLGSHTISTAWAAVAILLLAGLGFPSVRKLTTRAGVALAAGLCVLVSTSLWGSPDSLAERHSAFNLALAAVIVIAQCKISPRVVEPDQTGGD